MTLDMFLRPAADRPRWRLLAFAVLTRVGRTLMRTPLRSLRPLQLLYHVLYRATAPQGTHVVETPGGGMLAASEDEGIGMFLVTEGVFEPTETMLFQHLARGSRVILDVGANIGYFTLLAARSVGEAGRVVAIEPDARNADLLGGSVARNGYPNVDIERVAIGKAPGEALIFHDRRNRGGTSLFASNVAEPLGSELVRVTTLDALVAEKGLERVDLIKIDVQGAECLVLEGAGATLDRWHPSVLFEYWPKGLRGSGRGEGQVLALLRELGYEIAIVDVDPTTAATDAEITAACSGGRRFVTLVAEHPARQKSRPNSGLPPSAQRA